MRTIRTKVYQFSELSKAAKSKVLSTNREINVDDDYWFTPTFEDAEQIGLRLKEFDSDGASFIRGLTGEFINPAFMVATAITKEHGKHCETYKTAKEFLIQLKAYDTKEDGDKQGEYDSEIEELEDVFLHDLLIDYTKMLQTDLEYQQTDEAIISTIEANEYEFKADGTRF